MQTGVKVKSIYLHQCYVVLLTAAQHVSTFDGEMIPKCFRHNLQMTINKVLIQCLEK